MSDFDFSEILAEAESRLDDQGAPEHFGEELVLAEGESYTGRWRGEDLDRAFDPPRIVYLLVDLDGERRFLRSRTMLERKAREAAPTTGDYVAVIRGQDIETKTGRTMQAWAISSRSCSDPLPEESEALVTVGAPGGDGDKDEAEDATDDDIPF